MSGWVNEWMSRWVDVLRTYLVKREAYIDGGGRSGEHLKSGAGEKLK